MLVSPTLSDDVADDVASTSLIDGCDTYQECAVFTQVGVPVENEVARGLRMPNDFSEQVTASMPASQYIAISDPLITTSG